MDQHPLHAQFGRQTAGVLGCRTAVTDQQGRAGVVPLLDRDAPDRRGHGLDRDLQGPFGQLFDTGRQARPGHGRLQGGKAPLHGRGVQGLISIGTKQGRQGAGGQPTQQHIGVGDGQRSAALVGRRPGIGPGRSWAHLQTVAVKLQDRAPTGGHGVNGQHRSLQVQSRDRRL